MTLSGHKKALLREFVDFICEGCGKEELECGTLEIHRIWRGNIKGKYKLNNIKVLCKKCHKLIHFNEEGII